MPASIEKIPYLVDLGIKTVELMPVQQFDAQAAPERHQLLGLSAGRLVRAASRVQLAVGRARAGERVSRSGEGAPPRRHRGDSRRGVQSHGRGRRDGPDALAPRLRQSDLLHSRPDEPGQVHRRHRLRQHDQRQRTGRAADDPRLPAVLGRAHARRRISLRSGGEPVARRRRPAARPPADSARHRGRSRAGRDEDHRRGLGRGRFVSAGEFRRRSLGRLERPVSRPRAAVRDGRRRRRSGRWPTISSAAPTCFSTPTACRAAASISSPPTTASRSTTSSRYDDKHNEANGEQNRDGTNDNFSWNCGVEGPTDDPAIEALRRQQIKNFFTILLLSEGRPMLLMGDEVRRTQQGNNNAYCQDNAISWFDWDDVARHADIRRFARSLIHFHQESAIFRDRTFWGEPGATKITWHGVRLGRAGLGRRFALAGVRIVARRESGEHLHVMLNAYWEPLVFELPATAAGRAWRRLVDTALESPQDFCDPPVPLRQRASGSTLARRDRRSCW